MHSYKKDLVSGMIMISENATPMTTIEMDLQCNCEKQEYQGFYSLTIVICNTSMISVNVRVLLKRHFQVNIEHSYSPFDEYPKKLIPNF